MDLTKYNFPKVRDVDKVFPTFNTDLVLLAEAKKRGFYNGRTPYNDLFSVLFFKGGGFTFKKGLDPEFKEAASLYLDAFMRSFAPKHEEKEAICSMLLSELAEININDNDKEG